MNTIFRNLTLILTLLITFFTSSCTQTHTRNLVPDKLSVAPNYWCTWYWQNYLIRQGVPINTVEDMSPGKHLTNPAAREQLNQQSLFGKDGMAQVMLPETRSEYYFLIDHGWQDKSIKKNTFFSMIMDTNDFHDYADLEPKKRIKKLNEKIKGLGWRGLGLWVRGSPPKEDIRKFVEWSKYAGIKYWKIDGGDTKDFWAFKIKQEIYPELALEYVTGSGGPLNTKWNEPDLQKYPSVYSPGSPMSAKALRTIENSDIFRTYDAVPLLVTTVTLQRIHDILAQTSGNPRYHAFLNIQDDTNIAAALGCVVAVKRHPMNGSRMFQGRDIHLQVAGDRHIENRMNEMDRFVRFQRIAPPMPAGFGTYQASEQKLIDKFVFRPGDTWLKNTWGNMVTQSAPAIMVRNIPMPKVIINGQPPYVMASRFPNDVICIATEGRVTPDNSWQHPKADITLQVDDAKEPIGVFGYYKTLTLQLNKDLPKNTLIFAQDLLAENAIDITEKVKIDGKNIVIPGQLIDNIGTLENKPGDISMPGLVIRVWAE